MAKKTRKTIQKELMSIELKKINSFFNAEEFYSILKKKDSKIGLATIYRFLKEMKKENKIIPYICQRRTLYSKTKKNHCHFICEKTGKIIHFNIESIDFLNEIKSKIPGTITSFQLEIRGVCDKHKFKSTL